MPDTPWIDLGPVDDFPPDSQRTVHPLGAAVVILHAEDSLYAVRDRCPHAGLPLGDGERRGLTLTCPYHGFCYNIKTGRNVDDPQYAEPVPTYPVRVHNGRVMIQLPTDNAQDQDPDER